MQQEDSCILKKADAAGNLFHYSPYYCKVWGTSLTELIELGSWPHCLLPYSLEEDTIFESALAECWSAPDRYAHLSHQIRRRTDTALKYDLPFSSIRA